MNKEPRINNKLLMTCIGIALLFIFITRGYIAFRTIAMIILVYVLPATLIFYGLNFKKEDSLFYSFFISLGLFSYGTYFISLIFGSLRLSLIVLTIMLYIAGNLLYFFKNKKRKEK